MRTEKKEAATAALQFAGGRRREKQSEPDAADAVHCFIHLHRQRQTVRHQQW